jgi:Xaa-Pro dipeptidase
MGKLPKDLPDLQAFSYGDDPATWSAAFETAFQTLHLTNGKVGLEPARLRFLELSYMQKAGPAIEFVDANQVFSYLRMNKGPEEIEKMKQAARIAQAALLETLKGVREGITEKEIANKLLIQLLKEGSDPEIPFAPIVAIGENSANPHAVPTDRALKPGDLLLIDWGASYEGYLSDITRTFTFGDVDPELLKIGEIVLEANQAGRQAGKAGLDAGAVDRAARSVISSAGYGHAFIHRTGRGLGMEAHEEPYIYSKNDLILTTGATFTIEPGIYLPGKGGVRIEDDVVVTEEGLVSLTDLPRQVLPLESLIA